MAKKILSYMKLLGIRVRIAFSVCKYRRIGAACVLSAGLLLGGVSYFATEKSVLLLADGKEIGRVASQRQVETALEAARQELSRELEMEIKEVSSQLSYETWKKGSACAGEILAGEELVALLKEKLAWPINTWAIKVDGQALLYLASEAEAQSALEELKTYYLPQEEKKDSKVEKIEIQGEVQIVPAKCSPEQLKTVPEAVLAMVQGPEKIVPHSVCKGESLWTIARDYNLTVAELQKMNASLKSERLQIGQELNVKKAEPLVNVVALLTTTVEEKIPYAVEYENDASLWQGQEKVKKDGANGLKNVTYRIAQTNDEILEKQTLQETVLQEPTTKIVKRGTKLIVASRSSGGSGILAWPTKGTITSPFGKVRGKSKHTGIDIDGRTGDPIGAAEDGTITKATWQGSYGNCLEINHGKGLVTRYAHLSKFEVTVGQKVSRGDLIGRVGSTGNSTGAHLHFEVIDSGKFVQPLNFLK